MLTMASFQAYVATQDSRAKVIQSTKLRDSEMRVYSGAGSYQELCKMEASFLNPLSAALNLGRTDV